MNVYYDARYFRHAHATAFSLYMRKRSEHLINKISLCIVVGEKNYEKILE